MSTEVQRSGDISCVGKQMSALRSGRQDAELLRRLALTASATVSVIIVSGFFRHGVKFFFVFRIDFQIFLLILRHLIGTF
jgi:hypothetical protein